MSIYTPSGAPMDYDPNIDYDAVPSDRVEWLRKKIRIYEAAEWHDDAARTREELAEEIARRETH